MSYDVKLREEELKNKVAQDYFSAFDTTKIIGNIDDMKTINDFIIETRNRVHSISLGYMSCKGNDFQNINYNFIINEKGQLPHPRGSWVFDCNLLKRINTIHIIKQL